jgi:hypothetical protein
MYISHLFLAQEKSSDQRHSSSRVRIKKKENNEKHVAGYHLPLLGQQEGYTTE